MEVDEDEFYDYFDEDINSTQISDLPAFHDEYWSSETLLEIE